MFPPRRELLKAREGTLGQTPLPLLLHALMVDERTCTLELKLRNLEKRIHLEDGAPVGCSSNLLHETLGKYLVGKGKLSETQYQSVLSESVAAHKPLGGLLVEKQLVSAFELFKHLQTNLAHKILDVFRWQDAKWKLLPAQEEPTPIRLNTAQLVFTGCGQLPDETLATHFWLSDTQRLALNADGPSPQQELKLSARDARLLQLIKQRHAVAELCTTPGFEADTVMRKLYALCVLEMIDTEEAVDARPRREQPAPEPTVEPVAPAGLAFADDDEAARNLLAIEFLSHRTRDPFELLGVPVTVQAGPLQKAFLLKAEALAPVRFKSPELRQKAESLLLAYARAYGALIEADSNLLHRKRREVAEEARRNPQRPTTASQFRIRTDLLDADSQFEEGRQRLAAGNFRSAVEHFEYACDIEPRGRFRAYLAWARYQLNPNTAAPRSLLELAEACVAEPSCEEAWAFRADLAFAFSRYDEAEDAYRKAFKLNPGQRRYPDAIRDVLRVKK